MRLRSREPYAHRPVCDREDAGGRARPPIRRAWPGAPTSYPGWTFVAGSLATAPTAPSNSSAARSPASVCGYSLKSTSASAFSTIAPVRIVQFIEIKKINGNQDGNAEEETAPPIRAIGTWIRAILPRDGGSGGARSTAALSSQWMPQADRSMFAYIDPSVSSRLVAKGKLFRIDRRGQRLDPDAPVSAGSRALDLLGPIPLPLHCRRERARRRMVRGRAPYRARAGGRACPVAARAGCGPPLRQHRVPHVGKQRARLRQSVRAAGSPGAGAFELPDRGRVRVAALRLRAAARGGDGAGLPRWRHHRVHGRT